MIQAPVLKVHTLVPGIGLMAENLTKEGMKEKPLNVCKLNFHNIVFTLCIFIIVSSVIIFLIKGRRSSSMKMASPVLFYLAKTSFNPEHYKFCKALMEKEKYDVNYFSQEEKLSLFLCSCLSGNAELVSYMIKQGANVQSVSHYGDTGLYLAAYGYINSQTPDLKVLRLLLESGCDINHQNEGGFTVLHLATLKGRLDLVRFFVLQGAQTNISNKGDLLPVDIALSEGYKDIAEFLMTRRRRANTSQSVYF